MCDTAGHYADIRHELKKAGTPILENDIWISALVRQHNMTLLSKDKHFDAVGRAALHWLVAGCTLAPLGREVHDEVP